MVKTLYWGEYHPHDSMSYGTCLLYGFQEQGMDYAFELLRNKPSVQVSNGMFDARFLKYKLMPIEDIEKLGDFKIE